MRFSLAAALPELWRSPPRGTALVEFGLAAPILILLLVILVDLGLAFYEALQVQGAASAGAEYASIHAFDVTSITKAVQSSTDLGTRVQLSAGYPKQICGCTNSGTMVEEGNYTGGSCSSFSACTNGGGVYAKVQAQLDYPTLIKYPGLPSTLTLVGTAYRRTQ
jgi:hypothetical protein